MTDHNATVPMRRTRLSREFMCQGKLLTPAQASAHTMDTIRRHTPVIDEPAPSSRCGQTTGRLEDKLARNIRRQHGRSWLQVLAVGVALAMLGLGVGYLFAKVATAGRV